MLRRLAAITRAWTTRRLLWLWIFAYACVLTSGFLWPLSAKNTYFQCPRFLLPSDAVDLATDSSHNGQRGNSARRPRIDCTRRLRQLRVSPSRSHVLGQRPRRASIAQRSAQFGMHLRWRLQRRGPISASPRPIAGNPCVAFGSQRGTTSIDALSADGDVDSGRRCAAAEPGVLFPAARPHGTRGTSRRTCCFWARSPASESSSPR